MTVFFSKIAGLIFGRTSFDAAQMERHLRDLVCDEGRRYDSVGLGGNLVFVWPKGAASEDVPAASLRARYSGCAAARDFFVGLQEQGIEQLRVPASVGVVLGRTIYEPVAVKAIVGEYDRLLNEYEKAARAAGASMPRALRLSAATMG